MAKAKGGLGRGLGALFQEYDEADTGQANDKERVVELALDEVTPNPRQPRKSFDEDKLTDLAESIREHGVMQPILVTPRDGKYMIIAGERRYRASVRAGLQTIPALVRDMDDRQVLELALIENVQRDDLTPVEEASAYNILIEDYGYTQERLAQRMGKSRSAIANATRLLALPEDVLQMVDAGKLTVGHVKPLLSIDIPDWQSAFAHEIYQDHLTARQVEQAVKEIQNEGHVTWSTETVLFQAPPRKKQLPDELSLLQEQLAERLGTKVKIKRNNNGGGKLVIEYYSDEDLKRIFDGLGGEFY